MDVKALEKQAPILNELKVFLVFNVKNNVAHNGTNETK